MVEEECRRGSGREKDRMNRVKGEICYGGLGAREISNDRRNEEERRLTGWAVLTSLVRWMSMTSGRSSLRMLELVDTS